MFRCTFLPESNCLLCVSEVSGRKELFLYLLVHANFGDDCEDKRDHENLKNPEKALVADEVFLVDGDFSLFFLFSHHKLQNGINKFTFIIQINNIYYIQSLT